MYRYSFKNSASEEIKSDGNSVLIQYSLPELIIENVTNSAGDFYRIRIPGHSSPSETGKPELPVSSRLLVIPDEGTFAIRISDVKSERIYPEKKGFRGLLFPVQEGEIKQDQKLRPEFAIDRKIYAYTSLIKSDTVTVRKIGKVRNTTLANLVIAPVRYNPKSNFIEVITSMKIEINFENGLTPAVKSLAGESTLFSQSLAKGTLNYYPSEVITGYSDRPVEMILVTDTLFRKHL
ncbi:MAG: hypothetical protein HPY62_05685, partial [Bacteroidales bacterium]|nr:hypothetical protein [Bacteroidales bacterium]